MKLVIVMKKYTHLFLFIVLLFNITTANAQNIQYIQPGHQRVSAPEVSRTGFWPLQSIGRAAATLALMTAEIAVPMGPLYSPEPPATFEAPPAPIKVMNQVEASASATPICAGADFRAQLQEFGEQTAQGPNHRQHEDRRDPG